MAAALQANPAKIYGLHAKKPNPDEVHIEIAAIVGKSYIIIMAGSINLAVFIALVDLSG